MIPSRWMLGLLTAAGILAWLPTAPRAVEPVAVAVAEFDYIDPSGGVMRQDAAQSERVRALAQHVRDGLAESGRYRVVPLSCGPQPCSAGTTEPAELLAKARAVGARLLVYGGIQRMNALIQYGNAEVVDLDADRLVFDRNVAFRNDSEEAWDRAAQFLTNELMKQSLVR